MKVRVKLFAVAKELARRDEVDLEIDDGATVADVREAMQEKFHALRSILPHVMWAIDGDYANDNVRIAEESEVALIPPVSGG